MPAKINVFLAFGLRFFKTPDGAYYTQSIYGYDFFCHYLNVFDEVTVLARTKFVDSIDLDRFVKVSGNGVVVSEMPYYHGMKQLLRTFPAVLRFVHNATRNCDCIIYRLPTVESYLTYYFGRNRGKPFAVEVILDPLGPGSVSGIFKLINTSIMRHIVKKANGASYVTSRFLQNLHPCAAMIKGESEKYFQSSYSSIDLDERDIKTAKSYKDVRSGFKLIHVSNAINDNRKGLKQFIEVIAELNNRGYNVFGCSMGDGWAIQTFKDLSKKLKIEDKIDFIGLISSREEVMRYLSESDLMLFPTYSEGLPRCVIEAGACGLPVLSTPVSGIPEILDKKYLFDPDDIKGFSDMIIYLIENTAELEEMSRQNVEMSKAFTKDKLQSKRDEFYLKLRSLTENS